MTTKASAGRAGGAARPRPRPRGDGPVLVHPASPSTPRTGQGLATGGGDETPSLAQRFGPVEGQSTDRTCRPQRAEARRAGRTTCSCAVGRRRSRHRHHFRPEAKASRLSRRAWGTPDGPGVTAYRRSGEDLAPLVAEPDHRGWQAEARDRRGPSERFSGALGSIQLAGYSGPCLASCREPLKGARRQREARLRSEDRSPAPAAPPLRPCLSARSAAPAGRHLRCYSVATPLTPRPSRITRAVAKTRSAVAVISAKSPPDHLARYGRL